MWLEWQLSFISNNQKKITGYHSRSLILARSDHLLCFIRYGLSLWRNMNALLFLMVVCTRAGSTGTCGWWALASIRLSGRRASVARFLVKRRGFCKDTFENLGSLTLFWRTQFSSDICQMQSDATEKYLSRWFFNLQELIASFLFWEGLQGKFLFLIC